MKTAKHRRETVGTRTFVGKSIALFIGSSLLLTVVSFGSITDHFEKILMWGTMQDSFYLANNESAGLKWNSLWIDSTDADSRPSGAGLTPVPVNNWNLILTEDESGGTESRHKRGKLAFLLRAGSASITADGYGSSFTYGIGLHMRLSEKIGLELILDRYSVPVSKDFEGMGVGKLQVTPLLVNCQWRFPLGRFAPYASAGAGFYFINFEPDLKVEPFAEQNLVYADRFALHLGGGVDVHIMRSLDFCADLRYSLIKTWIQARDEHHVEPAEQDMLNLNTLAFTLELRYYF